MPELPDPKARPHPFRLSRGTSSSLDASTPRHLDTSSPSHLDTSSPRHLDTSPPRHPYAELAITTNYTFLTGASHPEELVQRAAELGHAAAAIADTNTLAGIVRAHVAAKEAGIPLAVGCRLVFTEPKDLAVLVFATDRASYSRLCRLLTLGKRRAEKGECRLALHDLIDHHEGLLAIVVPPSASVGVTDDFVDVLHGLRRVFDDDRLSLAASMVYGSDDRSGLHQLASLARLTGVPLVATNDVLYHVRQRRALQDILTCIKHGCTIDQAGFRLHPNAERHLKPGDEMARLFAEHPAAIARAAVIAARAARFSLNELKYQYPDEICPAGVTPSEHLAALTWSGAAERYPDGIPDKVRGQVTHELALIDELKYAPYFLTVHDLVRHARSINILCQGRGAAANSAVCYCLGVTSVDPTRIDVLFERFISRERNEPPDIDIDFEHERREEVIQYIYQKYGRERAALTAEVITYRGKSALREVGKAMGLSLDYVDRLAKTIDWWNADEVDPVRLRQIGINPQDPIIRRIVSLVAELQGFPRHLSQHVGGFVITRGPLSDLVPIENAKMENRTVIEWDKDDIDAMGMLKVDCLGLGMLTCIRKCFDLLSQQRDGRNRCRGVEVSRCQGGEKSRCRGAEEKGIRSLEDEAAHVFWEKSYECNTVVPRSGRLAEEQASCDSGLSSNRTGATLGALWFSFADAPRGGVDSIEHRRGLQPEDTARVHAKSSDCQRLSSGTVHTVGDRDGDEVSAGGCDDLESSCRDRPHALFTDPQTEGFQLSPLNASRAEHIHMGPLDTSTPRHLDTYSLSSIPAEDPVVYDMICKADTIGVFQIESRAQMSMLPRLRPRCYYDLVIEVAIVRPGPIQGNMVHPYLRRRQSLEPVNYPSEDLRKVLAKTLGVPLFQEQAMQIAIVAGGFSPGEADDLRRAMAAWKRKGNLIHRFGEQLIAGMKKNGYDPKFAEQCFEQIKGFSEYGFPESHAASFALLVYVSSWLKCHHPAAFAAALINSQPMGFYQPAQIIRDARDHGVTVRPVDANYSEWNCTLERDGSLRLGMRLVSGMKEADANRISKAVAERGTPFTTIESLWRVSGVPASSLRRLAAADAFGSMELDRQHALWGVKRLKDESLPLWDSLTAGDELPLEHGSRGGSSVATDASTHAGSSTSADSSSPDCSSPHSRPSTPADPSPPAPSFLPAVPEHVKVTHDYHATGLSLKAHPISFIRAALDKRLVTRNADLKDPIKVKDRSLVTVAGIVLIRQRPGTASGIVFMTIEDETGIANLVLYPDFFERNRRAARHCGTVLVKGRVQREGEVVHVLATGIKGIRSRASEVPEMSRDFH